MTKGLLFWLVWICCLLFGGFWVYGHSTLWIMGPNLGIGMILTGLLGWQVFGAAVK